MNRHESRQAVVALLYEMEFHLGEDMAEVYKTSLEEHDIEENDFVRNEFFGALEKLGEIDALIADNCKGWKLERVSRVARAVMRLCVYELMYRSDVPKNVALNEAVELIKEFDSPEAKGFVNGVLNSVADKISAEQQ
jgi:N utilization substance protein B